MFKLKSQEHYINELILKYGDRYDLSRIEYTGGSNLIDIGCKTHGWFHKKALAFLRGFGCDKCSNHHTPTTEEFISELKLIHGTELYNHEFVKYVNSHAEIKIICNRCGKPFMQKAYKHLGGHGCPNCAPNRPSNTSEFIQKALLIHLDKYDYSLVVYIKSSLKVIIICKSCNLQFPQKPNDHLNGYGCPYCKKSKGETKIKDWLVSNNIPHQFQHTFDNCRNPKTNIRLKFDFYIPNNNLLIEFDGRQHFDDISKTNPNWEPLKIIQYRDNIKNEYTTSNNIDLLRIPYTKIKNINQILTKKLL
jgi:protein-arginine kinase activator protein McsA